MGLLIHVLILVKNCQKGGRDCQLIPSRATTLHSITMTVNVTTYGFRLNFIQCSDGVLHEEYIMLPHVLETITMLKKD